MLAFAYVSLLDTEAMAGMRGDVLTGVSSFLGIVVAVAAVAMIIRVITR